MSLPRDHQPVPPQNSDLEMSVLGAIQLEPELGMPLALDLINRDSFYLNHHSLIFDVMVDLHRQGTPPDSHALLDALKSRGLLDQVGGSGVVLGMTNCVPTAANLEHHARLIADKAILRQLIRACTNVIQDCYRQELSVDEILDRAESSIIALGASKGGNVEISTATATSAYHEALWARGEQVAELRRQGKDPRAALGGLLCGIADLDLPLGGLRDGYLIIVAARPSVGKTALALNFAHNICVRNGIPTALFSLEMGSEDLIERLICCGTKYTNPATGKVDGIGSHRLRVPELTENEWRLVAQSTQRVQDAPLYIDDRSTLSIGQLRSMARSLYGRHGIKCLIVDYLQLMSGTAENRTQEVAQITRGLKAIARELKIPVVALSQLSRALKGQETKRPTLSDLRESGSIEQDADVVVFIHPKAPNDGPIDERELIIAKNRNGPTAIKEARFFKPITRFLDATVAQPQITRTRRDEQ